MFEEMSKEEKTSYFVLFQNTDLALMDRIPHTNSKKSDNNSTQPNQENSHSKDHAHPLRVSIHGSKHFILSPRMKRRQILAKD